MSDNVFPIKQSSPRMMGQEPGEKRRIRRADHSSLPFEALIVGMSFAVPLTFNEGSLRVRISRENGKKGKQYSVIKWDDVYEVGCISDPANVAAPVAPPAPVKVNDLPFTFQPPPPLDHLGREINPATGVAYGLEPK